MEENVIVFLRGHHLISLYVFYFEGDNCLGYYSEEHEENTKNILREIIGGARIRLIVVPDSICDKCPRKETSWCQEMTAREDDKSVIAYYGFIENQTYEWSVVSQRLKERGLMW